MRTTSLILPCSLSLSLACHVALLAWFPNQTWLAGSNNSDTNHGLTVNIFTGEPEQTDASVVGLSDNVSESTNKTKEKQAGRQLKTDSKQDDLKSAPQPDRLLSASVAAVSPSTAPEREALTVAGQNPGSKNAKNNSDAPNPLVPLQENERVEAKKSAIEAVASTTNGMLLPQAKAVSTQMKFIPEQAESKTDQTEFVPRANRDKQPGKAQSKRYQLGAPHTPKPKYPRIAVQRRWQGEVLIAMQVRADGTPAKVTVKKGSGFAILDNSALKVLAKWRLAPSQEALETLYIPVIFRL